MKVLYWFRRDLRTRDNRALLEASANASKVAALYVIDEKHFVDQSEAHGSPKLALILDLLSHLSESIALNVALGDAVNVLEELIAKYKFEAVYTAKRLPGEEQEVERVRLMCNRMNVKFIEVLDNVLVDPYTAKTTRNFKAFYQWWRKRVDSRVADEPPSHKFVRIDLPSVDEVIKDLSNRAKRKTYWTVNFMLKRLRNLKLERYSELRDYPYLDGTSKLSPYISLGAVSVRELYNVASSSEDFIRQLAWREYYYSLYAESPWMDKLELKPGMRNIRWENDDYLIDAFVNAKTGYPIVDAGVRQLLTENWVHNRVRMIMASFLVKDLHVDWRIGKEFFKKHLIDYDKPLNVGNWQWCASVGVDPLPFRPFNPMTQSMRYDPFCIYIKKYVPELEDHDCRALHNPLSHRIKGYYEPVVDHYERIREFKKKVFDGFLKTRSRGL